MPVRIQGATEHNLRDIDAEFGDGLTVVTGVSGSGKTSLVFDTLYHESNRRFLDIFTLGSSAQRLAPASVRSIDGLGPAIAVGQNLLNRNPGSTLATASGLHPLLRLLYARFGERHCPDCGVTLSVLTEDEIVDRLVRLTRQNPISVIAPLVRGVPGSHRTLLKLLKSQFDGDALFVDGRPYRSRGEAQRVRLAVALTSRLEDMLHVLDEPTIGQHPNDVARLLPAFRQLAGPVVYVEHDRGAAAVADQAIDLGPGAGTEGGQLLYSGTPAGLWKTDAPTGRYFSLRQTVPAPPPRPEPDDFLTVHSAHLRNLCNIDVPIPLSRLTAVTGVSGSGKSTLVEDVLVPSLNGHSVGCRAVDGPKFKPVMVDQKPIGLNPRSNPATYTKLSDIIRDYYAAQTGLSASHFSFNRPEGACSACSGLGAIEVQMRYLPSTWIPCAVCAGQRFSDEVLSATASFGGRPLSIAGFYKLSIAEIGSLLAEVEEMPPNQHRSAARILQAMCDVGLGYLSLGQASPTLSGGEAQRVKLAKFLGRRTLSKQLLVLDEPTTGLHPRDIAGLLVVLDRLVRSGATIVVVEHDPVLIRAADNLVDLGSGAGVAGGKIVAQGRPSQVLKTSTLTARWLRGERRVKFDRPPRSPRGELSLLGARANNLRGDSFSLPLGVLTGVCGVSGSGKSTLLIDTLGRILAPKKQTTSVAYEPIDPGKYDSIEGAPERTIVVDQSRAGVGSPADFLDLSKPLRALYAASSDARALGLDEKQLSRSCSVCKGRGAISTDMGFLPGIHAPCEVCQGTGYLAEAWEVRLHDVSLPQLFSLTIDEVADLFDEQESLQRPLRAAQEVGLGYLVLRQPAHTLSGGEGQRLKIAKELCRRTLSPTLYLLDEPTIGQHLEDVARLIDVLHRLVDDGHTVVVVEHHPHLLTACDYLLELGPGGGPDGGRIIAEGRPRDLAAGETPTAPYLRQVLEGGL